MKSSTIKTDIPVNVKEWRAKLKVKASEDIERAMRHNDSYVINKIVDSTRMLSLVPLADREMAESKAIYHEIFQEFSTRIVKRFLEEVGK